MGGRQQPQIDAQTLLHLVRGRRTPAEAVASPRWVVEDLPDDDRVPPVAVAERSVPLGVVDAMAAAGFDVLRVDDLDRTVGHAQLVAVDEHGLHAGSDPRADGAAAAG
jgi:gamma-glutamyltranspeptidase